MNAYEFVKLHYPSLNWKDSAAICKIVEAYADSNDIKAERNLNFISDHPFSKELILDVVFHCIGSYNDFNSSVVNRITDVVKDGDYYIAREGSPAMYIVPRGEALEISELDTLKKSCNADELYVTPFFSGLALRFWWD